MARRVNTGHQFVLVIVSCLLFSCDCEVNSVGIVMSSNSDQPLANVNIFRTENLDVAVAVTDSTGLYDYFDFQEGADCPNSFELLFQRQGFADTIFLTSNSFLDTLIISMREL